MIAIDIGLSQTFTAWSLKGGMKSCLTASVT
jgi:hypothetical protein